MIGGREKFLPSIISVFIEDCDFSDKLFSQMIAIEVKILYTYNHGKENFKLSNHY